MFWEIDDKPTTSTARAPVQSSKPVAKKSGKRSGKGGGNVFGGPSMSKEFRHWCSARLEKLSGSDDTTLVEYLMTLDNEEDIRENLHMYLGNGANVKEFADGFLQQKEFMKKKPQVVERKTSTATAPQISKPSPSIASSGSFGVLGVQNQPPAAAASGKKKRSRRSRRKKK
mmetsp:Transcript_21491/g.43128  ORF Transcript_21491/g.43128 Transcript_21491/m.43128 type:complete len:171 (+) Transcript_21491:224-736(+)